MTNHSRTQAIYIPTHGGRSHLTVLPNPPPGTRLAKIHQHLKSSGVPAYRFRQLVNAVHQRDVETFDDVRELPGDLRQELAEQFGRTVFPLAPVAIRSAEQVEKVLFETSTGARLETVLSRYRAGWSSICVSSQAGCGLGCTFCATGAVGLVRNLTADEIYAQVMHPHWRKADGAVPDSVAFMGMGEALANPHVFDALQLLTSTGYGGLSPGGSQSRPWASRPTSRASRWSSRRSRSPCRFTHRSWTSGRNHSARESVPALRESGAP